MKKDYDPRMHSAEHLLNQTMDRMFGTGRCFSAHIEKKKSKCDYRFNRELTKDEETEIEKRMNELIDADMPVSIEHMSKSEAGQHFILDKLPEKTDDTLRIVRMGDYDACPCIGPHVKSTGEIGGFRIVSASFEKGVLRLRFKLTAPPE